MNDHSTNVGDLTRSICADLDLSRDVADRAEAYAFRAVGEYPINRSPKVIAASSTYLAAMMEPGAKRTQEEVAGAAGVAVASVRDGYHDVADHFEEFGPVDVEESKALDDAEPSIALSALLLLSVGGVLLEWGEGGIISLMAGISVVVGGWFFWKWRDQ